MISIIVPFYNGAHYLRECIESVITQNVQEPVELLLIDDGSVDDSLAICREYARQDNRIHVFHKENSGVSDTRNYGIDRACGDYIMFVDADDYLLPGALQKIENALSCYQYPDMLLWGFVSTGKAVPDDMLLLMDHPRGFKAQELLHYVISIDSRQRLRGYVWRCAFKREMLFANGVRFNRNLKMAEDFKFLVDAILVSNAIPVLQESLYCYRVNDSSVTSRYKKNTHSDMAWINHWMEQTLCPEFPTLKTGIDCCCAETYIVALQNLCNPSTPFTVRERIAVSRKIKSEYQYLRKIKTAIGQWPILTWKRRLVYVMLGLGMDPLYIVLFSIKRKTLFSVAERVT